MPRGRPLPSLVLTGEQREQLTAVSQSTSMPYGVVQRAPASFSPVRRD